MYERIFFNFYTSSCWQMNVPFSPWSLFSSRGYGAGKAETLWPLQGLRFEPEGSGRARPGGSGSFCKGAFPTAALSSGRGSSGSCAFLPRFPLSKHLELLSNAAQADRNSRFALRTSLFAHQTEKQPRESQPIERIKKVTQSTKEGKEAEIIRRPTQQRRLRTRGPRRRI